MVAGDVAVACPADDADRHIEDEERERAVVAETNAPPEAGCLVVQLHDDSGHQRACRTAPDIRATDGVIELDMYSARRPLGARVAAARTRHKVEADRKSVGRERVSCLV